MKRAGEYLTAVTVVLIAVAVWFHFHDARVREQATIDERLRVTHAAYLHQDSVVAIYEDSLHAARGRTDTVLVAAKATSQRYDSLRARVDTVASQQPLGVPVGSVVVPIAYVRAADSLAAVVPALTAALEHERALATLRIAAADSSVVILRTEVAELRVAAELKKPGFTGKLKTAAVGGIIVAAAIEILGHH